MVNISPGPEIEINLPTVLFRFTKIERKDKNIDSFLGPAIQAFMVDKKPYIC